MVIEYLESHPDIFLENPHLLSNLSIPHIAGKRVTSLIEFQVEKLRHSDRELRQEIDELKQYQLMCDKLGITAYEMALQLQTAPSIEILYDQLFIFLKNEYACSQFLVYYFVDKRPREDYRNIRFRPSHSKLRYLFSSLFTHNKPLCDILQSEYLDILFGKEVNTIKSNVALPMQAEDRVGLMILGSNQYNTYKQGFTIHLLNYLKQVFFIRFNELMM